MAKIVLVLALLAVAYLFYKKATAKPRAMTPADARALLGVRPDASLDDIRDAHRDLVAAVARAQEDDPAAGHLAIVAGDILALMPGCDAIITDVSSVGLDWLYLRTDRPIVMTDPNGDVGTLHEQSPLSRSADVVDAGSVGSLAELLTARLEHDEHHLARVAMRHHYFDDLAVGESTGRFLVAVSDLVALRDRLLDDGADAITA